MINDLHSILLKNIAQASNAACVVPAFLALHLCVLVDCIRKVVKI